MGGCEPGVNRYGMEVQGNRLNGWNKANCSSPPALAGERLGEVGGAAKIDAASQPVDPTLSPGKRGRRGRMAVTHGSCRFK